MNATPKQQRPTLTDRLRRRTAFVVDPAVAFLDRLGVSPDALTIIGMMSHALFAWLIADGRMLLAGLAIALISPLDGLDGALARRQGKNPGGFGAFLDSTSDRLAEIILYAGYGIFYYRQEDAWLVVVSYLALTGSLMVSYTRSRAEALGLSCKVGLLTRVERYVVIVATLILNIPHVGLIVLAIGTYFTFLQRVIHVRGQASQNA